ncbi:MAG: hypothetical protein ACRDA4_10215 [Filifactoraceae bacterium]
MIGIIGASGDIGLECTRILNNYGIKDLKLGYRKKEKVVRGKNVFKFVDLEDMNSYVEFVEGCDCIINCSRYSDSIIFNLIDEVNKNGSILIDLSYYNFYERITLERGTIYHGVGSSPGLMESLPIIISKVFDKIYSFKIHYASVGKFTFNAAKEYLRYLNEDGFYASSMLNSGNIEPHFGGDKTVTLPISSEKWMLFPYIDKRTRKACKQIDVENAMFYICIKDGYVYNFLKKIHSNSVGNLNEMAQKLVDMSRLDNIGKTEFCGFVLEAIGIKDENMMEANLIIKSVSPTRLTALTAAAVSLLALEYDNKSEIQDMNEFSCLNVLLDKMMDMDTTFYYRLNKGINMISDNVFEGEI